VTPTNPARRRLVPAMRSRRTMHPPPFLRDPNERTASGLHGAMWTNPQNLPVSPI
jgi:hypothetical protein